MFGSRKEPKLMDGRKIVWSLSPTTGVSFAEAMRLLHEFQANYQGDRSELLLGYWEYGDEIIITAPEGDVKT